MSQMNAPTRVTRDELAQIERIGGTDSTIYQRMKEQCEAWEAHLAANKAEDDRLRAEHERKREAVERAYEASREAERKEAAEAWKAEIRIRFFAVNPHATEEDFERVWPRLSDDALVAGMTASGDAEVDALQARSQGF